MGGKKSSKKPPPKKVQPKLDRVFNCPFCNHEKSVSAKLDFEKLIGTIGCNTCMQKWECHITKLYDPIDVYSDWIDACEDVNKGGAAKKARGNNNDEDDD